MQLARVSGASVIIVSEPLESRRKRALELGADYALDPKSQDVYAEVRKILPDGPDVIMDCTGIVKIVGGSHPAGAPRWKSGRVSAYARRISTPGFRPRLYQRQRNYDLWILQQPLYQLSGYPHDRFRSCSG